MTLWELEFVYEKMREHGYAPPMLDVGGVFNTTVSRYAPNAILPTTSEHIWSNLDIDCDCTHDVEAHAVRRKDRYCTIVSTSTLEHCSHPFKFLDAIASLLTPGGLLVLVAPFMWPVHGDPVGDRWRFTPTALGILCQDAGLVIIESRLKELVPTREMSFVVASKGPLADRAEFTGAPPL